MSKLPHFSPNIKAKVKRLFTSKSPQTNTFQTSTMAKLSFCLLLAAAVGAVSAMTVDKRATGGYIQNPSGGASFTMYSGCGSPGTLALFSSGNLLTT